MTLLRWTGHPLADVGVATLCAMVDKDNPEDLTLEDLDKCGDEILKIYQNPVFAWTYLVNIFLNGPFNNGNPKIKESDRQRSTNAVVRAHRQPPDASIEGIRCVFSNLQATHMLDRQNMPLLSSRGRLNFFPNGQTGLPVSGAYALAIQSIPLGGRRSEGNLMLVHCDVNEWTLSFTRRYLERNRRLMSLLLSNQLPEVTGPHDLLSRECAVWDKKKKKPKYPDAKSPQTLIMCDLSETIMDRGSGLLAKSTTAITTYLVNSGQEPKLSIEQIPSQFVTFLRDVQGPQYKSKWDRVVHRAWRVAKGEVESEESEGEQLKKSKKPKKKAISTVPPGAGISRNEAFSDLYSIFSSGFCDWNAALKFVRRHLLCNPNKVFLDPSRYADSVPKLDSQSLELIDWQLTSLFLERILGMNKERIALIRSFADQLAELIDKNNDKKLFRDLVFTETEYRYRGVLSKVQRQYAQDRKKLVISFDQYVELFLDITADEKYRWSLIRDLISIRLVEALLGKGFFGRSGNEEVLAQSVEKEAVAAE
ncbi:MAG TPA: hypothetical protein VM260_24810 [Pirellula sp.]|nr:hypothetical protein [Pirellula sp.]